MPVQMGEAEPTHQTTQEILPAIDVRQRPKFELFVFPDRHRWEPSQGRYLPALVKAPRSPGVMGVGDDGDASPMLAYNQSLGGVYVRQGDGRLKMPGDANQHLVAGNFRVRFVGHTAEKGKGQYLYGFAWEGYERITQGPDGSVEWREDSDARIRFQLHLLKLGIAVEPTNLFRRSELGRLAGQIRDREGRQHQTRQGAHRLNGMRRLHAELVADLRAHGEDVPVQFRLDDTTDWKTPKRARKSEPVMGHADAPAPTIPDDEEVVDLPAEVA